MTGYVRVQNNSGEDYENAQTRLIVGQVHLLDQIADLARRQYPYGSPVPMPSQPSGWGFMLCPNEHQQKDMAALGELNRR